MRDMTDVQQTVDERRASEERRLVEERLRANQKFLERARRIQKSDLHRAQLKGLTAAKS